MRATLFLFLMIVSACGRPLSPSETAYLTAMAGDDIAPEKIRIVQGHLGRAITYTIPVRPRTTCQERIWPPITHARTVTVSPSATVVFNTIYLRRDHYRADFVPHWPEALDLADAMLFAHEMTHVWQWQNRARTGFTPLRALREHTSQVDPYLFDPETTGRFLDYGYEQQGSIVEEYVCCRILDPEARRTTRLRSMIAAEMPLAGLDEVLDTAAVRLPWRGVQIDGICRAEPEAQTTPSE